MRERNVLYISYDGALEPIAQSQVLNYIKELSKNGFKFHLVSFEKKKHLSDTAYLSEVDNELNEKGIKWHRLKYHGRPKILSTFFDVILGILFCSLITRKNKIDIIHARSEVSATIALVVSRLFRAKFLYDRRGIIAYDYIEGGMWPRGSLVTKIMFRLANAMDRIFLLSSDHIVVLTKKIAEILKKEDSLRFKKRLEIKVIPCCADLDRFKPREKDVPPQNDFGLSDKFVLLYTGSLGTWYMLKEMSDFFIELKKQKTNAHFLILTMSEHSFADGIIRSRKINESGYTIIGRKYKEMPKYVIFGDAAIMFIKPVFSKIASCPTKFAECLACGLPVVINSKIGDTQDLVERNEVGVVVDGFSVKDYQEAARKLLALMEDRDLSQRCRDVARQNFSLEYGVKNYLEIYKGLE